MRRWHSRLPPSPCPPGESTRVMAIAANGDAAPAGVGTPTSRDNKRPSRRRIVVARSRVLGALLRPSNARAAEMGKPDGVITGPAVDHLRGVNQIAADQHHRAGRKRRSGRPHIASHLTALRSWRLRADGIGDVVPLAGVEFQHRLCGERSPVRAPRTVNLDPAPVSREVRVGDGPARCGMTSGLPDLLLCPTA